MGSSAPLRPRTSEVGEWARPRLRAGPWSALWALGSVQNPRRCITPFTDAHPSNRRQCVLHSTVKCNSHRRTEYSLSLHTQQNTRAKQPQNHRRDTQTGHFATWTSRHIPETQAHGITSNIHLPPLRVLTAGDEGLIVEHTARETARDYIYSNRLSNRLFRLERLLGNRQDVVHLRDVHAVEVFRHVQTMFRLLL